MLDTSAMAKNDRSYRREWCETAIDNDPFGGQLLPDGVAGPVLELNLNIYQTYLYESKDGSIGCHTANTVWT